MVPVGGIIEWFGSIVTIPANYVLCDGNNGTPDLRGRSIIGAGDQFAVDQTGGDADHQHLISGSGHSHSPGGTVAGATAGPGLDWDGNLDSAVEQITGSTTQESNRSPFHALAFIMRVA